MLDVMGRWFLLDDRPAAGALNMALDELLLARAEASPTAPVLRLYSFDNPTLTLGFHQNPERTIDIEAARRGSIDVVRRFTGGRALLHVGELTYCVAARTDREPFGEHLQSTFLRLSEALAGALRILGVEAAVSAGRKGGGEGGLARPCLDSVSRHEGRNKQALLQHGSILLDPTSASITEYLKGDWGSIRDRVTSVMEETGRRIPSDAVREAVVEAFEREFNVSFEPLMLTATELEELERRRASKREESRMLCSQEACA
jgi:lipoate-protein ligase A